MKKLCLRNLSKTQTLIIHYSSGVSTDDEHYKKFLSKHCECHAVLGTDSFEVFYLALSSSFLYSHTHKSFIKYRVCQETELRVH